jgi:hypothetical protein
MLGDLGTNCIESRCELFLFLDGYIHQPFKLLLNPHGFISVALKEFQSILELIDNPFRFGLCPVKKLVDDPLSRSLGMQNVSYVKL